MCVEHRNFMIVIIIFSFSYMLYNSLAILPSCTKFPDIFHNMKFHPPPLLDCMIIFAICFFSHFLMGVPIYMTSILISCVTHILVLCSRLNTITCFFFCQTYESQMLIKTKKMAGSVYSGVNHTS